MAEWQIDREAAKSAGYTDQEIDAYLNELNKQEVSTTSNPITPEQVSIPETPSPVPTPGMSTQAPDMVNSISNTADIATTEGFGYGHPAVDKAPLDPNANVPMTNSIGGVPFSGTVTDPSGQYYEGFGNYYGTVGASPEELAQMSPEEKVRMATTANSIMATNPSNEAANEQLAGAFPGKNVNFNAHLQNPIISDPQGIATGSANLTMGSTGRSTGKHTHQQFIDVNGQPMDYEEAMNIIRSRQYR
jgi:hypothetical protein